MRKHIPQEIWDTVNESLPDKKDAIHASRSFGYRLPQDQETHMNIWFMIFKTMGWLSALRKENYNPILVGEQLRDLYRDSQSPAYLVLLTSQNDSLNTDIDFEKGFFQSLKPHRYNEKTREIMFEDKDCNITLDVSNLWGYDQALADTKRLFSYDEEVLRSSYLLWHDNQYKPRMVTSEDIAGLGEKPRDLQSVSEICAMLLTIYPYDLKTQFQFRVRKIGKHYHAVRRDNIEWFEWTVGRQADFRLTDTD